MQLNQRSSKEHIASLAGKLVIIYFKPFTLFLAIFAVIFFSVQNKSFAQANLKVEAELVVVEVELNGQMYGSSIIAIDAGGLLYAREESLVTWKIQKPYPQAVQINGQLFHPISTLGNYTSVLDTSTYQLSIELAVDSFQNQVFDLGSKGSSSEAYSESGVFLDYDINLQHDSLLGDQSGFIFNPVVFSPKGHWVSRMAWQNNPVIERQSNLVFLENYFRHDNTEKQTTLIVGDSVSPGGRWSRALNFAGIRYGRNFALQPREITFPLPAIRGEALIPSTVDLYVNQNKVANNNAAPGIFEVRDIPIVNGAGELQLVVTDTLGRQTIINSDFYASTELLRKGLSAYSINLGVLKNNLGIESFSYGDSIGVVDYQYGLNDKLTLSARAESDSNRNNVGVGMAMNLWHKGILNTNFAISDQDDSSAISMNYQYSNPEYRINFGYQYSGQGYSFVGSNTIIGPPKQQFNMNAGMNVKGIGSLGFSYISQSFYYGEDLKVASLNLQTNIKRLFSLSAYVSKVSNGFDNGLSFGINFSRSFGADKSFSVNYTDAPNRAATRAQFNKYVPYGEGVGYNVVVADNGSSQGELALGVVKKGRQYGAGLDVRQLGSETGASASINGSLSMLDGRIELSREIHNAFALVKVADIPDVRVYLENQLIGKTDDEGYLLVPGLRPYDINKLNISVFDLPIQTQIEEYSKTVSPYQNSGSVVSFNVSILRNYQFILMKSVSEVFEEGSSIYLSNPIIDSDAQEESITGLNGLVFLNLSNNKQTLYVKTGGDLCVIDVELLQEYDIFNPPEKMDEVICQILN